MSEKPRGSAEHDYPNDLELRKRILVRKIKYLIQHDSDVQAARAEFNSLLGAFQSDVTCMTDSTIAPAETTIKTMASACDVPEGEFDRIAAECYDEYRRELADRASSSSETEVTQPRETRKKFHWLFGGWLRRKSQ